ncbi:hypothetical protein AAES_81964 [Amazona aestiva]|uniref:Uncharacterized protein n=1 Tax=Amazona aestiva TaxID=12930 RepID=A0A0Q3MFT1_AMAAE|nr:hypothetical protein AAES_81964 [Amazona aestiva]
MALNPAELLPVEEEEPHLLLFGLPPPAERLGLAPLLQGLSAVLEPDGLTVGLRGELRQAPPAPLLPLLELRLAAKVLDLSIYHTGEATPEPPLLETVPPLAEAGDPPPVVLRFVVALREEAQRLQRARQRHQHLQGALRSQRRCYQEVEQEEGE